MDTQDVIDLTSRAADSVLRFRTVAFSPRPVIDAKSINAAIATQIRGVAKQEGNRFETPLTDVIRYAGLAVSRAIQSWNKVSDNENHIDREWFRNCVCDLVSGAVNEIGHKAFQYNELNASEYLDPEDYDPFDVTTYSTNRRSTSVPSSSEVGLAYYGFARGASHQSRVEDHGAEPDTAALPLRYQVNQGWKAIHSLAASYTSNNSTADFIEATAPLGKKRSSLPNESDTSDPDLQVIKHRTKRARRSESSPTGAASAAVRPNSIRDSVGPKKKVVKMSWTEEEVDILFKGRQDGKDWDKIHAVLPRHTRCACQKKYRDVSKQREKREMSVLVQDETQLVSSPSSGFQGDAEDDVVNEDENDMNE
ncbi:hypothetical protein VSDG_08456 [Cytospora chrysosperma]|uniref:Myb-like domain-containing protein n=1 Tax=Cytospora chrysosperma TaxID=252740 RepID=A0A423VHK6_CYTCH|nr:hypothetical protein VSDG_08456 [Valsa sordida]